MPSIICRSQSGSAVPSTGRLLQRALEAVVARHEALRTTIVDGDGGPLQVVAACLGVPLPVTDLTILPDQEREDEVRRRIAEEAQAPFDLAEGPLMRARLLCLAGQENVLLLTLHHIVADGWSMEVLLRELAELYEGFVVGAPVRLPDLPIQYPDYAVWQRRRLQTDAMERQLAYWKRRLAGAPPILELPTDRPRTGKSCSRAAGAKLVLSKSLADDLTELSRREGVTLFMTLLAAFKILLARYSGQDDVVVGTPIAGRTRTELEDLIGCFLNTLVLRTDLSGKPTFRELLARVRETALGAYAHQELPFERLVEELQPAPKLRHNPLFQVLFQAGPDAAADSLKLDGLEVTGSGLTVAASAPSSTFHSGFGSGAPASSVVCAGKAGLFSSETFAHLLDQFRGLLEQVVTSPESPTRSYSLVTDRSRALLPDPRVALAEPVYPLGCPRLLRGGDGGPVANGDRTGRGDAGLTESWRQVSDALVLRLEAGGPCTG